MIKNVDEVLKEILLRICKSKAPNGYINDNTNLVNNLGFDSLEMMKLVFDVENEFEIIFDDEDIVIEKLAIYKNLRDSIQKKLSLNLK